jgi:methionine aminopeptidase
MKLRHKILIIIVVVVLPYIVFDRSSYTPLKSASNTSIEGFVCTNETKVLSLEQQKRMAEIEKALSWTNGWEIGGHGVPMPIYGPVDRKLYPIKERLSLNDWQLLSEIYVTRYSQWGSFDYRLQSAEAIFAIAGKKAIEVLECTIDNANVTEAERKNLRDEYRGLGSIKRWSERLEWLNSSKNKNDFMDLSINNNTFLKIDLSTEGNDSEM